MSTRRAPTKGAVQVKEVRVKVKPHQEDGPVAPALDLAQAGEETRGQPDLEEAEEAERKSDEDAGDEQVDPGIGGEKAGSRGAQGDGQQEAKAGKGEDDSGAVDKGFDD